MGSSDHRDWREICEDVIHEKDSARLNELLEELLEALEQRARTLQKRPIISDS